MKPALSCLMGLAAAAFLAAGAVGAVQPPETSSLATGATALQRLYACKAAPQGAPQLDCYAAAAAEVEKAEQSGQIVVIDKRLLSAKRKENFGFRMPTFQFPHDAKPKDEAAGLATFEIDHVFRAGDRMIFFTTDGAVWAETESRDLPSDPAKGSTLVVRRGTFGSYYCTPANMFAVQCRRDPNR